MRIVVTRSLILDASPVLIKLMMKVNYLMIMPVIFGERKKYINYYEEFTKSNLKLLIINI